MLWLEHGVPLLPLVVVVVWFWLSWEARRYRRQAVSPPAVIDDLVLEPWPHEELRHIHRRGPAA